MSFYEYLSVFILNGYNKMLISEKYCLYIEIMGNEMSQLWNMCDIIDIFEIKFKQSKNFSFIGVTLLNYFYPYWCIIAKYNSFSVRDIIGALNCLNIFELNIERPVYFLIN